jgi:hypothetical protein
MSRRAAPAFVCLLFVSGAALAQVAAVVHFETPHFPVFTATDLFRPSTRVEIAGSPGLSTYVVHLDDRVLRTNDVRAVVKAISVADRQAVNVTALSVKQRETFARSAQAAIDSETWRRNRIVENAAPLVRAGAMRSTLVLRSLRETSSGYEQRGDAWVDWTSYSFRAVSRLQSAVIRFFERLNLYFGSKGEGESTFDVVHRLRHEVADQYGLSDDELQVEIRDALGSSYWVQLRRPGATDVW